MIIISSSDCDFSARPPKADILKNVQYSGGGWWLSGGVQAYLIFFHLVLFPFMGTVQLQSRSVNAPAEGDHVT